MAMSRLSMKVGKVRKAAPTRPKLRGKRPTKTGHTTARS